MVCIATDSMPYRAFSALLQNYKGARRAFQTCIAANPDFSKAWVSWAQVNFAETKHHTHTC